MAVSKFIDLIVRLSANARHLIVMPVFDSAMWTWFHKPFLVSSVSHSCTTIFSTQLNRTDGNPSPSVTHLNFKIKSSLESFSINLTFEGSLLMISLVNDFLCFDFHYSSLECFRECFTWHKYNGNSTVISNICSVSFFIQRVNHSVLQVSFLYSEYFPFLYVMSL